MRGKLCPDKIIQKRRITMGRKLFRNAVFMAVILCCLAFSVYAADKMSLQVQVSKPGSTVDVERIIGTGKVVVKVVDSAQNPVFGLGVPDFSVSFAGKKAEVLMVKPLVESLDVPRHIVMVLDNSYSMKERNAIEPLLSGVDEVLKTLRPVDDVVIVAFAKKQTVNMGGRDLHVQTFKSNQPAALHDFAAKIYREGITDSTYLYEAMLAGLELIRAMPTTELRFMVVFSDGQDINSSFNRGDVIKTSQGVGRFNANAIDYMPGSQTDKFLTEFTRDNRGQTLKADSASGLGPIFKNVSSKMQYYYVVSYGLPLMVSPASVTIEEIKTIDASPMLAHIFFDEGSSEIPARYARLAGPDETAGFDEQKFRDTLEKYYQVLNIIGKRLTDNSKAKITLVGCNSNTGKETGNKKLSTKRAEAVRNYLENVWKIAPGRISIEARNLPAMPSVVNLKQGQAENRRVEIRCADMTVLAPIQSVYTTTSIDTQMLKLHQGEIMPVDITSWKLTATNSSGNLANLAGSGTPPKEIQIPLPVKDLQALATGGDISVNMEIVDKNGQTEMLYSDPVKVNVIRTSERIAQKQEMKVQEKYALILFDFNKDTLSGLNQEIIKRLAGRIKKLPKATAEITGHTDNTGKEAYNMKLSDRRALAVYKKLSAECGKDESKRIHYKGAGSKAAPFDNATPEGRGFNRTVTITLDYMSAE
jgi:outer membrane protein OmpA-like peptidoglycan-associated protein